MTHLDDGRLHALMDKELDETDTLAVRIHLDGCNACQDRMAELEARSALVAEALGKLDTAAPTSGARTAVLERVESREEQVDPGRPPTPRGHGPSQTRRRTFRTPLARAAILVLFLGGVATALPASPVRGWIAAGWALTVDLFDSPSDSGASGGPSDEAAGQEDGDRAQSAAPAGIQLDPRGGEISIVLSGISPATQIVVRMVPSGAAGAFADEPATFRTSEGRIEVTGATDRVLVDLPLDATSASIQVNGGIYLRSAGDQIDAIGPIESRTPEEIRFRVP
jgi:anti-sigma factor RsiW